MTSAAHPDPTIRMLCQSARELQLIARRMLEAEPKLAAPAYELALSTMLYAVVRDRDLLAERARECSPG